MKNNKKTIVAIAITITVILIIALIGVYWYTHPTHYLYEDRWIIGKTADQIEQRYGSYDDNSETIYGLLIKRYCVKPGRTDGWGNPIWPEYYTIFFDEDGKAYKVEIVLGGEGG